MGSINIFQRVYLFLSLLLFLTIIYSPSICAEDYYADVTIDVDSSGFVTIDGITNYPNLTVNDTQIYTSMKQSYWLLNITKEENFTDFVYVLTLPAGASMNYIKSSGDIRIEENQGRLVVRGIGENEPFLIRVQYQIGTVLEKESIKFDPVFLILITIIIVLTVILVWLFIKERMKTEEIKEDGYDFKGLNQRQKEIMRLLIDGKIPLTQTDIQKELNIPKASVSRNIHRLERKGLIEKEQIGMSNLIRLKKP